MEKKKHGPLEAGIVLVIFFLFAVSCFLTLLIGAGAYRKIADGMQENHTLRTCFSTIAGKVRATDPGRVSIRELDGQEILVLQKVLGETVYNTYIYPHGGALYELFAEASRVFEPKQGDCILPAVRGFSMRLEPTLLVLTARDERGQEVRLSIALPGEGGAFE